MSAELIPTEVRPVVLSVDHLSIAYRRRRLQQIAVRDVSLEIRQGEVYGVVGESGCGKSTLAFAIMRHLPENGAVTSGAVHFEGMDLLALPARDLQHIRGNKIAMVYQDPGTALNPVMKIGDQIDEVFQAHAGLSRKEARVSTLEMLERVKMPGPEIAARYPHQLSGGMQQRAIIAMALATKPHLLVLDEPTTGLDATVEAAVLNLVTDLRRQFNTTILFISHNLAVLSKVCDRVGVLYAGELVEQGRIAEVFSAPQHPYTAALLACLPGPDSHKDTNPVRPIPGAMPQLGATVSSCSFAPRCPLAREACTAQHPPLINTAPGRQNRCFFWQQARELMRPDTPQDPNPVAVTSKAEADVVLHAEHMARRFGSGPHAVQAVDDVSFDVRRAQVLGIVGESGSGKSTMARCVAGLLGLTDGRISLDGKDISGQVEHRDRTSVKRIQMVFQSPEATLNPRQTARKILARTVRALTPRRGAEVDARVDELAELVALSPALLDRYPGSLSGGQRQRVAIARAFAADPDIVLCDEPVSALDVSVQAAILRLLTDLQRTKQVSYVFISHDLSIVRYIADWIGVMYRGSLVESGPAARVLEPPSHPYTEMLFNAMPRIQGAGPARAQDGALETGTTMQAEAVTGCPFHQHCPRLVGPQCRSQEPPAQHTGDGHTYRCWIEPTELRKRQQLPESYTA